ncbi:hypothetical protein B0H11DRAFT_1658000, partial [Mycena galericulata]
LSTNRPPLEHEIISIRSVLAEVVARKMRLDSQIDALQSALDKCLKDRRSLKEEIKKHEGTLSPLRRMPPELLSLVFRSVYPTTPDRYNADPAPWTVSQVCRYWRAVVLSQPSFW